LATLRAKNKYVPGDTKGAATAGFYGILAPFVINKLFVYGTLKTETHLLDELVGSSSYRFLGHGTISGKKLEGTTYPAVVKTDSAQRVSGELIELEPFADAISKLDAYEAFYPDNYSGSLYLRERVYVVLDNGQTVEAWVYYFNDQGNLL
jgi:gamma-glutamylcyclotransferase (GGCT)/AIG2-like uncharacterized protein YtfP